MKSHWRWCSDTIKSNAPKMEQRQREVQSPVHCRPCSHACSSSGGGGTWRYVAKSAAGPGTSHCIINVTSASRCVTPPLHHRRGRGHTTLHSAGAGAAHLDIEEGLMRPWWRGRVMPWVGGRRGRAAPPRRPPPACPAPAHAHAHAQTSSALALHRASEMNQF